MKRENEDLQKISKNIVESDVFKKSPQYINLLNFLVNSFINNSPVKESILEVELSEIFGKDNSYDGKVRVYMFNLRKKLDEYYRTDGINDGIILKIEKGQYNLSTERKEVDKKRVLINKNTILIISGLVILVSLCTLFVHKPNMPNNFWEQFMRKNINAVCYVGDHYTVWGNVDSIHNASVHFEKINTESAFDELIHNNTLNDSEFDKTSYSFVTKMGPICSSKLTYWLAKHNKMLDIRMESEFITANLVEEDIIYIGPYKTLTGLKSIFLRNSKKFDFNGFNIIDKERNIELEYTSVGNTNIDYVMVSYNPISDDGHKILFFASNNDIGVMSAVTNFTNDEWLNKFYKNLPNKESHFNALFQVTGLDRTNIENKLISIEILD